VWLPEQSVLFAGDLVFNGGTPFLLMGSISGAIRAVESLRGLGPRTVVPGHGQICGPEVFDAVLGYVRFVQGHAVAAREAGLSPLEAARQIDLGPYSELLDSERLVGNLHRAYADLDGASVDLFAALADMVAFNGGKLRTDA
jgi:cyclase